MPQRYTVIISTDSRTCPNANQVSRFRRQTTLRSPMAGARRCHPEQREGSPCSASRRRAFIPAAAPSNPRYGPGICLPLCFAGCSFVGPGDAQHIDHKSIQLIPRVRLPIFVNLFRGNRKCVGFCQWISGLAETLDYRTEDECISPENLIDGHKSAVGQ